MRHKYDTHGIVLARYPSGETNAHVIVLTREMGIIRARAQGMRRPGAKLASALATFAESTFMLVRGKEGWRVTGAVLTHNWFRAMETKSIRVRAARICGLLLRLSGGETSDRALYEIVHGYFESLGTLTPEEHELAEVLAALRILAALGLDAGDIPGVTRQFTPELLSTIAGNKSVYIARINKGISASGL